jgi:hypothetical protein
MKWRRIDAWRVLGSQASDAAVKGRPAMWEKGRRRKTAGKQELCGWSTEWGPLSLAFSLPVPLARRAPQSCFVQDCKVSQKVRLSILKPGQCWANKPGRLDTYLCVGICQLNGGPVWFVLFLCWVTEEYIKDPIWALKKGGGMMFVD